MKTEGHICTFLKVLYFVWNFYRKDYSSSEFLDSTEYNSDLGNESRSSWWTPIFCHLNSMAVLIGAIELYSSYH